MLTAVSLDQEPTKNQVPTSGPGVLQEDTKAIVKHYPLAVRLALRNDYVHGGGALRVLAHKHGVSFPAAKKWTKEERWFSLRENWVKLQQAKTVDISPPEPKPAQSVDSPTSVADSIACVNQHITKIDRAINEADSGRELRDLMMARKLAVDQWGYLTGYAKPGTRRQSRKGSSGGSSRHSDFVPLDDQEGGGS